MNNNFEPNKFDGKPSQYEQNTYSNQNTYNASYTNQNQNPYTQPNYQSQTSFNPSPIDNKPKKKAKKSKAGFIAIMLVLATTFGFGGSIAGNVVYDKLNPSSDGDNKSSGSVITQSIVNTSSTSSDKAGLADVVAATENSVVEITTEVMQTSTFMEQYVSEGAGSGVIVTSDGYIITNNHVIEDAQKITVTTKDGTQHSATLIGADPANDIAVIKIEGDKFQAAVLGSSEDVKVGDVAIAIGNPLGQLGGTVTEGIVSALDREITIDGQVMTLLQTSAAVNPGNSGGGLFNDKGELIAIVNAKTSASGIEGLAFAIPIDTAQTIAKDLIEYGYVRGQIKMGVSFINILDNQTAQQYRVNEFGVYVYQVYEGTDAEKAGLKSGDIFLSIDGKTIRSSDEIVAIMSEYEVGDTMNIIVSRNGQEIPIPLTFSEYHPQ